MNMMTVNKKSEMTETEKFCYILDEMRDVFVQKNSDYGNSFVDTIREFGYVVPVARLNDKLNRLKKMVKGDHMNIKSETMRDNFLDIANYCVLALVAMEDEVDE